MINVTNHEEASLERYLVEIGKEKLLTEEEERTLAGKVQEGNKRALDKLVTANLKLVVAVAKKYQGKGLRMADLINEGNIGLILAAEKYDARNNTRFALFAAWWIRKAIEEAVAEQSRVVTMTSEDLSQIRKLQGLRSAFEQENGLRPNVCEMAEEAKMSEKEVKETLAKSSRQYSVDAPVHQGAQNTLLDIIPADILATDEETAHRAAKEEIRRIVRLLDDRERRVVSAFYGIDEPAMTFSEIGKKYGMTRERARQIRKKALRHMRAKTHNRFLRSYLAE